MASGLSRRQLAKYTADQIVDGKDAKEVLRQLAAYLLDHRRMREVELVTRDIEARLADRGYVKTSVWSARELTESAKASVLELAKVQYPHAKDITLVEYIDESLIGGVKVAFPGTELDASVKTKLNTLTSGL